MIKRKGAASWRKQQVINQQLSERLRRMIGIPIDAATTMRWHPPQEPVERIVKLLLNLGHYGYQPLMVFRDWVAFAHGSVRLVPHHLRHIAAHGRLIQHATDLPSDLREREMLLRSTYDHHLVKVSAHFHEALNVLLEAADQAIFDYVGAVYERMELAGQGGQFFTPWPVALAMAEVQGLAAELTKRLMDALRHPNNISGSAVLLAWAMAENLPPAARHAYFLKHMVPAAQPYLEPLRLVDVACGSGRLLLAAAATIPHWANVSGCVSYTGYDNDSLCVAMAAFQADLYGLNSAGAETFVALDETRMSHQHRHSTPGAKWNSEEVRSGLLDT